MANIALLLKKLLEFVGDSDDYFVSGSLSCLPLLNNYRQPLHDVDAAVSRELFQTRRQKIFAPSDNFHLLRLSELAVASSLPVTKVLNPMTGFVHVHTPNGLHDLSCYYKSPQGFVFTLGVGLTLEIPTVVSERFRTLSWNDLSYQAGPSELAFIP